MDRPMDRLFSGAQDSSLLQSWAPLLIGGALVAYGLSRRSFGGALVAASGGALAYRGIRTESVADAQRDFARSTVLVNSEPSQVFQFWRDFENFPRFMHHLHSVTKLDDRRSKWIALGPANSKIEWTAEIVTERENEIIAWRSTEDSQMQVDGAVEFRTAPGDRGTIIDATILYRPPAGSFGSNVAKLVGKDPTFLIAQDLRRFKALIETGEIPTTEGQSHGPRSAVAAVARVVDPDNPIKGDSRASEVLSGRRRVS